MRTTVRAASAILVGTVLLAGCGGDEPATGDGGSAATTAVEGTSEPPADGGAGDGAVLSTADSEYGEIVVDGEGMVVYVFDNDTPGSGESACSGDCLANWPAVEADSEDPVVDGVTGEVGTIERDDGTLQVTLEGLPLYLFAGDAAAGDTTGQAVNEVWWVVGPDGATITEAARSEPQAEPAPDYSY